MFKQKKIIFSIVIFFTFAFLLFTLPGCPTEPDDSGKITPPDTTSNNFTWQKFTFGGEAGSSYLNDVAIVNDTTIWAVGSIFLKDSTGQPDPEAYSLAVWNGKGWKLKKIYDTKNNLIPNIRGILAFSSTNIWLADGAIHHWDGVSRNADESFDRISLIGGVENYQSVNKLFGINSNNIYGVGYKGMISHYQNGQWNKIESGTDLDIQDIWGITDKNGKVILLCAAYNFGSGGEKKLIRIQDSKVDEIPWIDKELFTVWFNTTDIIYAGGEGLFYRVNDEWKEEKISHYFEFRVRGNNLKDIWTCGGFGFASHFNGNRWKIFNEITLTSGNYLGLSVSENLVALVGNEGTSAVIAIGRR